VNGPGPPSIGMGLTSTGGVSGSEELLPGVSCGFSGSGGELGEGSCAKRRRLKRLLERCPLPDSKRRRPAGVLAALLSFSSCFSAASKASSSAFGTAAAAAADPSPPTSPEADITTVAASDSAACTSARTLVEVAAGHACGAVYATCTGLLVEAAAAADARPM